MTTVRQSQGAMRIVRRYPRVGAIFLLVVGTIMTWHSIQSGKKMARFSEDSLTEGRVIRIEDIGTATPEFQMTVSWTDDDYIERTSTTRVFKYDSEHFHPGDTVQLLVASDDPGTVMLKRIYDNQGLVTLGSIQATPLIFFGALLLLGGVFLLATGNAFLRSAD
jgi:hypothetical protein